jgi:hypothetical protein
MGAHKKAGIRKKLKNTSMSVAELDQKRLFESSEVFVERPVTWQAGSGLFYGFGILLIVLGLWMSLAGKPPAINDGILAAWRAGGLIVQGLGCMALFTAPKLGKIQWVFGAKMAAILITLGYVLWCARMIFAMAADAGGKAVWCLFDDAMISLRYAWNLAHGHGLVWNAGGEHVEGFTNLASTLLMALPSAVFSQQATVLAVQMMGLFTLVALGFFGYKLSLHLFKNEGKQQASWLAFLVLILGYLYFPNNYWALAGMEPVLAALCLTVAALILVGPEESAWRWLFPVALGVLSLIRPDAVVLAGFLWLFRVFQLLRRGRFGRLLTETLLASVFPLAALGFRKYYYGQWVPNTYVLKVEGIPLDWRWEISAKYIASLLGIMGPVLALAFWGALVGRSSVAWMFLILVAVNMSLAFWAVIDQPDLPRTQYVYAPFITSLLVLGIWKTSGWIFKSRRLLRNALTFGIALSLAIHLAWPWGKTIFFFEKPPFWFPQMQRVNQALTLKDVLKPEAKLGVFWAGILPYYSGCQGVDFLGKSDSVIAHKEPHLTFKALGHNKYDLNYSIVQLQPDFIETYYWHDEDQEAFVKKNYVPFGMSWLLKRSQNVDWAKAKERVPALELSDIPSMASNLSNKKKP